MPKPAPKPRLTKEQRIAEKAARQAARGEPARSPGGLGPRVPYAYTK